MELVDVALRQFFEAVARQNNRSRKRLNLTTPYEVSTIPHRELIVKN